MTSIFIDNGTTGTLGAVSSDGRTLFSPVPVRPKEQDYTKKKQDITRIDTAGLKSLLMEVASWGETPMVYMERPLINPGLFKTSIHAARAFEAVLVAVEELGYPHWFVDSKEWQRGLLPSSGKKGVTSAILKKESMDIGLRLFPQHAELIRRHRDADGILGAYAFQREGCR